MTLIIPAPMLATNGGRPFTSDEWVYEIKFDGYRTMARAGGGAPVQLLTKNGTDCTKWWYPEVAALLAELPGGPHVIDGEACVLDGMGRSDFNRMHARAARRRWVAGADPVTYCAFDLLVVDGRNVMGLPLSERKRLLAELLAPLAGRLIVVSDLPAQAELFAQVVLGLELEGFVAKRLASTYQPGIVSRDWLKVKHPNWQQKHKWKG